MPGPINVRSGQLVEPVLTNISRGYSPEGFVADTIAPRINVVNEVGKYVIWDSQSFFATDTDALTPDRAPVREVDLQLTTDSYIAEEYALKASISRRERDNVSSQLNLRQAKQMMLMDQLMIAREVRVANALRRITDGGGLTDANSSTPSNNWDTASATIEADIKTAKEGIYDAIGQEPTHIVIPYKVANAIAIQTTIRDIFKYTVNGQQILGQGSGILPPQIWGLTVVIPRSRKTASHEGASSTTYSDVWGDDPRVVTVNPNASLFTPSTMYTLQARQRETRTYQNDDPQVEYMIQSDGVLVEKVTAPDSGWIIKDVLS